MKRIIIEISKEEYEKALKEGAETLICRDVKDGYGFLSPTVFMRDRKYYLEYIRKS